MLYEQHSTIHILKRGKLKWNRCHHRETSSDQLFLNNLQSSQLTIYITPIVTVLWTTHKWFHTVMHAFKKSLYNKLPSEKAVCISAINLAQFSPDTTGTTFPAKLLNCPWRISTKPEVAFNTFMKSNLTPILILLTFVVNMLIIKDMSDDMFCNVLQFHRQILIHIRNAHKIYGGLLQGAEKFMRTCVYFLAVATIRSRARKLNDSRRPFCLLADCTFNHTTWIFYQKPW